MSVDLSGIAFKISETSLGVLGIMLICFIVADIIDLCK